ncbi:RnfABCDGE type electron transport complex subunit D [Oceanispirochaeta crateris]|uniref:RnfABCDGE type electron transport complex subunit D n=2 Tax=Oceanispirochaeta crateris TaxID=2518645 RepID=A0A5C1QRM8_9SPIO|nr:RnfABCDGE type electron transport complex subunit D [Oceanispirochaeta crateris]
MMRRVVYSLIPIMIFSVYLYGLRSLIIHAVVLLAGTATEYLYMKTRGKKVSEAVLVTSALYALSMPPMVPLWVAVIGIIFGVLFGKCIFGGFGRNIFNPAITGRLFVYISFPSFMTSAWMTPGRFGTNGVDAVSTATPLGLMRSNVIPDLKDLILGVRAGSLGESAVILIIIAGIYLIYTKTASWRIIVSTLVSFMALSTALFFMGASSSFPPMESLFSGSVLFVIVFMATDPVTGPKKNQAQYLYGIVIGSVTCLVRIFSLFPEGTSFGILMGNTFASLFDEWFTPRKGAQK